MADEKITALPAIPFVSGVDLIAVVDDPSGTPLTTKSTVDQLATFLASNTITLLNKTLSVDLNSIIQDTPATGEYLRDNGTKFVGSAILAADLPTAIDATKIADGTVTNTEFQFINTVTSNVQTQINNRLSNFMGDGQIYVGTAGFVGSLVTMGGDATVSATGSITIANDAITTVKILNDNVTYAKIQNVVADNVILGNVGGAGAIIDELTGTQATTILNVFTDALKGLAPLSGGGTTNFLRADGTWAAPPGGSGITTLNTLTAATQTFAVAQADELGISSVTSTHTFSIGANIPRLDETNLFTAVQSIISPVNSTPLFLQHSSTAIFDAPKTIAFLSAQSGSALSDGFGPALEFWIDRVSQIVVGKMSLQRQSADDSATLVFETADGGILSDVLRIDKDGLVEWTQAAQHSGFVYDEDGPSNAITNLADASIKAAANIAISKLSGDVANATGDTYTGAHLFNAATMRIPLSATPTMAVDGDFAIDTTVADFSHGIMKYFDGEELGVVAMPIAQFTTPANGDVVAYNSTNDEFELITNPAGFSDPMTTRGDIIIRNSSNTTDRLAIGANTFVLTSDGTDIAWAAAGAGSQTPWTQDIDADTFALTWNDIDAAAPAGSVEYITNLSTGLVYNVFTGLIHDWKVNNVSQMTISASTIDFQANTLTDILDITSITSLNGVAIGDYIITSDNAFTIAGTGLTSSGSTVNVGGTADRISLTANTVDIASTYVGQTSITTLGTIATGTWQGTTIAVNQGGTGVTTSTGTTNVVLSGSPTIVTPTIASLTNMQHNHTNAAGGGQIAASTALSDFATLALVAGDVYTGTHDFGGANDLEIPNGTGPTVDTNGQIAIDTSVTGFDEGLMKFFSTAESGVVSMPIAKFTSPTDGFVVAYNSTDNNFELVEQTGGSGGAGTNETIVKSIDQTTISDIVQTLDDELFVTLPVGLYSFTTKILANYNSTEDFKYGFGGTATFTGSYINGVWDSDSGITDSSISTINALLDGTGVDRWITVHGFIDVTVTGTFGIEWAQVVSTAVNITVRKGSSLTVKSTGTGGGLTLPVVDTTAIVKGSADATKLLRFEVDGFTTLTTRVVTPPDANIIMAGADFANAWGTINQNIAATGKWQEAGVNISPIGDHDQYLTAGFFNEVTAGAISTRILGTGDNRKAIALYPFTNAVNEFIVAKYIPPTNYDGGTFTIIVDWTTETEGAGNVLWAVAAVHVTDGDDLTAAATNYGTEVILSADTQSTINFEEHTARSAAVTPANTYVAGDALYIRIQRRGADGGDTFTQIAQLMGVNMRITTDAAVAV